MIELSLHEHLTHLGDSVAFFCTPLVPMIRFIITALAILSLLPIGICTAQTIEEAPLEFDEETQLPEEEEPIPASIDDVIHFTQDVLAAAQKSDCEKTINALNAIPLELRERVAFVIAHIDSYEVSRDAINTVQANSRDIALHASACPALTDIYRSIATDALKLKTQSDADTQQIKR